MHRNPGQKEWCAFHKGNVNVILFDSLGESLEQKTEKLMEMHGKFRYILLQIDKIVKKSRNRYCLADF